MKRIEELRKLRNAVIEQMRSLVKKAQDENRSLDSKETEQYDKLDIEQAGILNTIEREERQAGLDLELDTKPTRSAIVEPGPDQRAAPQGAKSEKFDNFGEFLLAVRNAGSPGARVDPRLSTRAASGINESVPSDGGYLVQQEFATDILSKAYETGILASKVTRVPIGPGKNGINLTLVDESSRATGSRFGGVQMFWAGEGDTVTASKPKLRQLNMRLEKIIGLCYQSEEMLEDATAMDSLMRMAFSDELGFLVDDAIVNGTGVGRPLGFINAPGSVSQAAEGGQTADTIVSNNVIKMYARMLPRSLERAVWLTNIAAFPQLATMYVAAGSNGIPVWLPANNVAGQPFQSLLGAPVRYIEQAAALGDVGDIALVDPSAYLMIDKSSPRSDVSMHVRFLYDEACYRIVYRCNGQPFRNKPITPYKGANTLSEFVTLAAR